jgi:glycerophosphoryl diester phosphodiesterase
MALGGQPPISLVSEKGTGIVRNGRLVYNPFLAIGYNVASTDRGVVMPQKQDTRRSPRNPFARKKGLVVFAHRGGGGRWPENSMFAFQHAAELGVDGLELDIHSTADGELVVIHDPFVDRVTNGRGAVRQMSLTELRQLDAGYWWTEDGGHSYPFRGQGITIPTLAELLKTFPHHWINIDIKQKDPPIVQPFVEMLRTYGMVNQVCVGSFHTPTVNAFRRLCPQAATAATLTEVQLFLALNVVGLGTLLPRRAVAMQLPEVERQLRVVTPEFVRAAHRQGTAVHVWTVNDIAQMCRLMAMGVDGLMTDYPDILLKLLKRL